MLPALGVVVRSRPRHALVRSTLPSVTEVGVLPSYRVHPGDRQYYDPVGLPLHSGRFHHWLIRPVFADEAVETGLSCSEHDRAYVPLLVPRRDRAVGMSGTPVHPMLPSP